MNKKLYIYIGALVLAGSALFIFTRGTQDTVPAEEAALSVLTTENTQVEEASGIIRHTNPNFSFNYPKEWAVTSFEDAEGETILLRDKTTGGDVQLYIAPFDEETIITADRVKRDIPEMSILTSQQIEIGKAVSGVYFTTNKAGLGESQEIWFARDFFLYQISAVNTHPKVLADMVATFSFK